MNVILGVGGGIAAYKSAELARALVQAGATVQVVMTRSAQEFVRPLTFATLTGRKVITDLFADSSPEEIQQIMQKYIAWRASLQSRILGGNKLKDGEGHVLRKTNGKPSVMDGPFAEAKEVMAGFFMLEADSYDQAVEIAKTCPHMEYGSIEVRAIQITPS